MRLKGLSDAGLKRIAKSIQGEGPWHGSSPADTLEKQGGVHINYLYGGGEVVIHKDDDGGFRGYIYFPDGRSEEFGPDEAPSKAQAVVDYATGIYEEGMGGPYDEEGNERYFDYKFGVV